jgi:uncharacterized protein (UPF0332 family)
MGMDLDLGEFFESGHLRKITPAPDLAAKEFKEAAYDMAGAKKALADKDCKWATVKAYYAMFHSAKGILFLLGLKERAHFVIAEVLEALSKEGKLESRHVSDFRAGIASREGADYHYTYSSESAAQLVEIAGEFVARMNKLRLNLNQKH